MIINQIKGIYNSLTKREKKVADYIIERADDVIHYSITELANWAEVSETTVYRVIKKLGFNGYQDFKISLAKELSEPVFETVETEQDIFSNLYNKICKSLSLINQNLDKDLLNRVAERILASKKLIFFGVGRSFPVALDSSLKFAALGFSAMAYSDPHMQVIVGAGLTSEDTVISISHSGFIRDVFKSTQVAKDAGAFTIAITSGVNSPLSKISDIVIYTTPSDPSENEFTHDRIGEMYMIEILYNLVVSKKFTDKHFNKLKNVIEPKKFQ
ncbi:RpiR family transcriptional regulator [Marinitoga sp. 1135]|uniref:Transcriptional regulator n=1 Tax=Marinitoga piezophila (strain DSM 14283 / JCM 11233 / KA3) TaxID=443254 RepID=H2J6Y8_MARPK|nr:MULTISPECIES: MurR/RpiR family transcriptional regulator [Marinitoga]AEX85253.1 transcriptional regulator [Marinitoga piezophila KA3]APT75740.1 RpiR family transcriptional regulator [Marinitoga sp. 1137]NUU95481.1 RpiR family transcriptional regulator [Marinitoga sp. 1135]NUU97408.1 RpiR family transcriptional regulator [Marinitoga sp. 1138]